MSFHSASWVLDLGYSWRRRVSTPTTAGEQQMSFRMPVTRIGDWPGGITSDTICEWR